MDSFAVFVEVTIWLLYSSLIWCILRYILRWVGDICNGRTGMNVLCVMANSSFASLQKEGTTQRTVLRSLHISIVRRSGDRGAIMPVPLPKDEGGGEGGEGGGGER